MLQVTGDAKYADVMETTLYNGMLSGISLDGTKFFYTNPLSVNDDLPFRQRWSRDRVGYIAYSDCCPPNVVRTIAEVSNYMYSVSDKGLWFNLYGGNKLSTKLKDGSELNLTQTTDYPWNGRVDIRLDSTPDRAFSIFLRIPGWCDGATLIINGKPDRISLQSGKYAEISRKWHIGDHIELNLPMPVKLMEANPLVEEVRNQVAVKRGPVVYCLEAVDLPKGQRIFNIVLSNKSDLKPQRIKIAGSDIVSLTGMADVRKDSNWGNNLYREVTLPDKAIDIKLIPYYAWDNRGHTNMETWIPFEN
jgi:DUF1680 family protein